MVMKLATQFFLLFTLLLASGCNVGGIRGSGVLVTKDLPPGAFDKIEADGTFHVEVTQGAAYAVTVTADDNLWDYINVYNDTGTLHLGMKGFSSYQDTHLSAKIVLPRLTGLMLDGATHADVHGINDPGSTVELRISGASNADGDIHCQQIGVDVSGASTITLRGSADSLNLSARDASHAHLGEFLTRVTHAQVSGASDAAIHATGQLDFEASGASHLSYAGHPSITQAASSGASTVHPAQ
jgi:hypothetical protein